MLNKSKSYFFITPTNNSKLYKAMIYQIISTISRSRFDQRVRRLRVFITALWPKLEHLHCSHFVPTFVPLSVLAQKVTNAVQGCLRSGFRLIMKVKLVLHYLFFVISYLCKLSKRLQTLEYSVHIGTWTDTTIPLRIRCSVYVVDQRSVMYAYVCLG